MSMDRNWPLNTSSLTSLRSSECLQHMRAGVNATAFGYKIQALAAHVLVRLDYRIISINRSGHPDIVSVRGGKEFRFEIEAEVMGPRTRKLTSADFDGLIGGPDVAGYFALAISFPMPYWVLVPVSKLIRRDKPIGNALLEALSDREYSEEWTQEYKTLLQGSCREIRQASFNDLVKLALAGHRLGSR